MNNKQSKALELIRLGQCISLNEDTYKLVTNISKIAMLARKYHALCEMDCNGEGWIKSTFYTCGDVEHAKQSKCIRAQFAYDVGYEENIFSREADKVWKKINAIVKEHEGMLRVEFQGDPRGLTTKLFLICGEVEKFIDLDMF